MMNAHVANKLARVKEYNIDRLEVKRACIQDCDYEFDEVVIVCVHSHATLKQCFEGIKANKYHIIAIPCCVPLKLEQSPDEEYEDDSIWSEKNVVKIWRSFTPSKGI